MWRRLTQALVVSLLFGLLGFGLVFFRGGRPEQLLEIRKLSPAFLALAISALVLSFVFAAFRLQHLCKRLNHSLKFRHALRTHILGIFSAAVTPSGGGSTPAIALSLQYQGLSSAQAWATGIALFVADAIFLLWTLPFALIFLRVHNLYPNTLWWNTVAVIAVGVTAFIAYVFIFRLQWLEPIFRSILRGPLLRFRKDAIRFVGSLVESNRIFTGAPWGFYGITQLWTLLSWVSFFFILTFLARGLDIAIPVIASEAWQLVVTALSFAVPTPGGSGFFEFGTSVLLLDKGNNEAVPAVLLIWRVMTFYIFFMLGPVLGGYILFKQMSQKP
ncbi:MAG: lysylphosphatidylglycerol synthase transmembrane domain-containing protein [Trueperaceae bacterium]